MMMSQWIGAFALILCAPSAIAGVRVTLSTPGCDLEGFTANGETYFKCATSLPDVSHELLLVDGAGREQYRLPIRLDGYRSAFDPDTGEIVVFEDKELLSIKNGTETRLATFKEGWSDQVGIAQDFVVAQVEHELLWQDRKTGRIETLIGFASDQGPEPAFWGVPYPVGVRFQGSGSLLPEVSNPMNGFAPVRDDRFFGFLVESTEKRIEKDQHGNDVEVEVDRRDNFVFNPELGIRSELRPFGVMYPSDNTCAFIDRSIWCYDMHQLPTGKMKTRMAISKPWTSGDPQWHVVQDQTWLSESSLFGAISGASKYYDPATQTFYWWKFVPVGSSGDPEAIWLSLDLNAGMVTPLFWVPLPGAQETPSAQPVPGTSKFVFWQHTGTARNANVVIADVAARTSKVVYRSRTDIDTLSLNGRHSVSPTHVPIGKVSRGSSEVILMLDLRTDRVTPVLPPTSNCDIDESSLHVTGPNRAYVLASGCGQGSSGGWYSYSRHLYEFDFSDLLSEWTDLGEVARIIWARDGKSLQAFDYTRGSEKAFWLEP